MSALATSAGARQPPGPRQNLVVDRWGKFLRVPLKDYLTESFGKYGDFVGYRFFNIRLYLLAHPRELEHVLHANHTNYTKGVANYGALKKLVGEGLLTSDGPVWLNQRRRLQPVFLRQRFADIDLLITDAALRMVGRWRPFAARRQPFDLLPELARLALEIFGQAFLGTDITKYAATIAEAWTAANEYFGRFNLSRILPFPTLTRARSNAALRMLHSIADDITNAGRRSTAETKNLLSALVVSRHDEDDPNNERRIRDELLTLMLTGYETTATALCWTWYLLSRSPSVARALNAELMHALHGRPPKAADLERLQYVRIVVDESLRMYPPAWLLLRSSLEDDEMRGCRIPKGSIIMMSPYLIHRHPSFWRDPECFLPERFSNWQAERRHPLAYCPFGAGPRMCIGRTLAMMESRLILATVAQHYRLELVPGHKVAGQGLITLRPRYGLMVTAHPI